MQLRKSRFCLLERGVQLDIGAHPRCPQSTVTSMNFFIHVGPHTVVNVRSAMVLQCCVRPTSKRRGIRGTQVEPSIQDIVDEVAPIKEASLWG